jgi:hypothetical protein
MGDSDRVRDRATRLFALALKAREDGKLLLAEEITRLAIEASDHADEMDRDEVQHQQPVHGDSRRPYGRTRPGGQPHRRADRQRERDKHGISGPRCVQGASSRHCGGPAGTAARSCRNVRMDLRWHGDDNSRARALAQELVGLQPEIIVTYGTQATVAVQRETRTIPIVFASVGDPVVNQWFICPHLRRRPGPSRSCQPLRSFTAT